MEQSSVATMSDYLIADDEAWIDLREGVIATVVGKLESVRYGKPAGNHSEPGIVITFADWSMLAIECDDTAARSVRIPLGRQVAVKVERTEDGLRALAIWDREQRVPIALAEPTHSNVCQVT